MEILPSESTEAYDIFFFSSKFLNERNLDTENLGDSFVFKNQDWCLICMEQVDEQPH